MVEFLNWLMDRRACNEAIDWVGDMTFEEAWKRCDHPHWMQWLLENNSANHEMVKAGWPSRKELDRYFVRVISKECKIDHETAISLNEECGITIAMLVMAGRKLNKRTSEFANCLYTGYSKQIPEDVKPHAIIMCNRIRRKFRVGTLSETLKFKHFVII